MSGQDLAARIIERARLSEVHPTAPLASSLASYLSLLAAWNKKINLTALDVGTPSDDAIDRLIVEPLVAARQIRPTDGQLIDIGSGGGSPGLPVQLAAPHLRVVLVESKSRKAAFLQEACRHLSLTTAVENCRAEELPARFQQSADVVTVRAVRPDRGLLSTIAALLRPGGRVFCFGGETILESDLRTAGLTTAASVPLVRAGSSLLVLSGA